MRHLFLAAALLAAAPAHAFEEPYSLAPGSHTNHGHAWSLAYQIGRRDAALAHCPDIVRGPRYGDLERAMARIPGVDLAAARARAAYESRQQRSRPLAVGCSGGLRGLMGYELARRRAPLDPKRMSVDAMICHGMIPEAANARRDSDFCRALLKAHSLPN